MPLWFVISTVIVVGGAVAFSNWLYGRSVKRLVAKLDHWDDITEEQQLDLLRDLKIETFITQAKIWRMLLVIFVLVGYFTPGSMLLMAQNAEETNKNADETNATAADLRDLVVRFEDERRVRAFEFCLFLNGVQRSDRQGRLGDIAAISRFMLRQGATQETVDDLANDRLQEIPSVEETDRDCDASGTIDDDDYPPDE